jgi:hypothetical protein
VATCLRRWRALPLRSTTSRWRALPLAERVPFYSTKAVAKNSRARFFGLDSKLFSKTTLIQKWIGLGCSRKGVARHHSGTSHQIPQFYVQLRSDFFEYLYSIATFVANSKPHTGARPSVRLCAGLMNTALRCTMSAAAGNSLGTTIKYLQRTASGAAGNGRAQRLITCDVQRAAPRAEAWAPRSIT